jgi:ATP-dependent Clp protease protease subunit
MSTDHKLDHKLKATSEDPIWHMHEYDVDLQSNHIYLMGSELYAAGNGGNHDEEPGIEYVIANRFIRNLNLCMRVNPNMPILIHMKTNGGYWEEGMAIYDAIKSCPFPVTILSYTHARSMSSLIFQAANKRVMMPHSTFMFHDGTLGVEGTVKQVNTAVEFGKVQDAQMNKIYIDSMKRKGKFMNRSRKWIQAWLREQMDKKEDVYLTAEQAVEFGFADQIFDYNWQKLTEFTNEELGRG